LLQLIEGDVETWFLAAAALVQFYILARYLHNLELTGTGHWAWGIAHRKTVNAPCPMRYARSQKSCIRYSTVQPSDFVSL
jgi:hypothetical protein